ncbi:MAG TPA: pitrilysin family protein [Anaeromyxobacteraceae bacterium]|jgi:zinc protease|nr:pitrilysin family protein [Anaeromyxobacteraceae bacterium]
MSDRIALPAVLEERLDNGLELVLARREGVPLCAVRLLVRAGSALDPANRHGLAHLVSQAARRGTARRSGREVDEEVEGLGAELGAGADEDASYVGLSAPSEFLPQLLDVVADVTANPAFPATELSRIRRREVAGLAHLLDEPGAVADRAAVAAVFGKHPYGHPVDGRARHLSACTRADVAGFHRRWFGPRNATLVVVGDLDPSAARALARRKLGRWRSPAAPPPAQPPVAEPAREVLLVDRPDASQTQVRVAVPAFQRASPEYFPGVVANAVFGGGFTSRLMEAVRVNRGLSYGVRSRFAASRSGGFFYMSSFTKNETAAELVDVLLTEAARFRDGGPSEEELLRTQSYLCGLYPLALETHDQVADKLTELKLYGLEQEEVTHYRERVRAVTPGDCVAVARRHFPVERGVVVAVGPAKLLRKPFARFGPVREVSAKSLV